MWCNMVCLAVSAASPPKGVGFSWSERSVQIGQSFSHKLKKLWGFFCTCFMLLKRGEHFLKCNCKKESALLFSPLRTKVLLNSKKLDSNEPGDVHLSFGTVNICVSDFSAAADYALPANHLLMISHLVLIICRLAALTTVSQITKFI